MSKDIKNFSITEWNTAQNGVNQAAFSLAENQSREAIDNMVHWAQKLKEAGTFGDYT